VATVHKKDETVENVFNGLELVEFFKL